MNDYVKLITSFLASFIVGAAAAYKADGSVAVMAILFSGLTASAAYVLGYWQTNPRLQPTTAATLLTAVDASTLSPAAKLKTRAPLAQEALKKSPS